MANKSKEARLLLANVEITTGKLNAFEQYVKSVPSSVEIDESILSQLLIRTEQIKPILDKYEDLIVQLQSLAISSDEVTPFKDFEEKYFNLISHAGKLIKAKEMSQRGSDRFLSNTSSSEGLRSPINSNVKLPVLSIPTFTGNYSDWASFNEAFTALIENNSGLSDIEKFLYLQNALKGSAKDILSELTATSANYNLGLRMLRDRYSNKKLEIFSHLEGILEINKIHKESAADLRKLHDNLMRRLRALDNLKVSDSEFKAAVISYVLKTKLDPNSAAEFSKLKIREIPSLESAQEFLSRRCETLEEVVTLAPNRRESLNASNSHARKVLRPAQGHNQTFAISNNSGCRMCGLNHQLFACTTFKALSVQERLNKINELKICTVCLRHDAGQKCSSRFKCRVCYRAHNNLLCLKSNNEINSVTDNVQASVTAAASLSLTNETENSERPSTSLTCTYRGTSQVLLPTAIIKVRAADNKWYQARVLLDSASQCNFITNNLCTKLALITQRVKASVRGICANAYNLTEQTKVSISSMHNNFETKLNCLVIPKISGNLPSVKFNRSNVSVPANIKLADSKFNISSEIDILIGASLFYQLLCIGQISLGKNQPSLQKTLFGWVVSGNINTRDLRSNDDTSDFTTNVALTVSNDDLQNSLSKFWLVEEVAPLCKKSLLSPEEQFCEKYFRETVTRTSTGRFMVSIPFNSNLVELGESKQRALERFYQLEKKLSKNPSFYKKYSEFINEYISLGHMSKFVPLEPTPTAINVFKRKIYIHNIPAYYLPHHAVFKSESLTTKIRVVFDGSAKSSSNISLNDTQLVGPIVQDDLFSVLIRFRQHQVALTGDVEKMYRMIQVEPSQRKFQCILWREKCSDPIETYQLNTITYGTAAASYLATRCLKHLANLNQDRYPEACAVIKSSFYMDDLLYSGETIESVIKTKNQIIEILASAGLPLRKLLSNKGEVLTDSTNSNTHLMTIPLGERSNAKALGLAWNSISDTFYYDIKFKCNTIANTKRSVLSTISQLFDPLGLLSPIIIRGKILIQELWKLKLSWDECIPSSLDFEWDEFKRELFLLNSIQVQRALVYSDTVEVELHGFSDASGKAYGACVYVLCRNSQNQTSINLLCSKSRVAPLRPITIPRLELNAAVLLAQLMQKLKNTLTIKFDKIYLWTDSMVVLNWLNSAPNKYKTFVANRIAVIQELFDGTFWNHVKSEDNPADLVSRGVKTVELINNSLWWHGPAFLQLDISNYLSNIHNSNEEETTEVKSDCLVSLIVNANVNNFFLFDKYSSYSKLQRVLAYILRFISNCRNTKGRRNPKPLSSMELQTSATVLIKFCQREAFANEIRALQNKQLLKTHSNLISLNPFLDNDELLRVGGRLKNSEFNFEKKFPLLLPKDHSLTKLIILHFHHKLLHCGPQQLLACMRELYWPISGKGAVKRVIHKCVTCFKATPIAQNPLMGNLPFKRVQPNVPAFYNTGVDYAGPIMIKDRKLRGSRLIKSYICLFVCLVTKAIHLELVTDLSSDAFIGVLKRFIARRGKPFSISSDNGRNFVGADNTLRDIIKFLKENSTQNCIYNYLTEQGIKWEFIIPHAPHQGGIWEGGIKSTKNHLKKILGNTNLTFEDFYTVLVQVEAVLNSRPLSPLSTDPNDPQPLTPGHFLIGQPLCGLPEVDWSPYNVNKLSLFQRSQRITRDFWMRWSKEVVPELQRRTKWFTKLSDLLKEDSVVLIKDERAPPLTWKLGRVIQLHRGADGVVRSVTLRVGTNEIKRAVNRLCVLPESD